MERRSFLGLAIAALPLYAKSLQAVTSASTAFVTSAQDRYERNCPIPAGSTAFKISTQDAQGALFVMEHNNRKESGPPRHLHHNEDEWFYIIEGEYLIEVGSRRHRLKSGDSLFGPREVPHAWAFVGITPGWLLRAYTPPGKMKAFFAQRENRNTDTGYPTDAAMYRAGDMELLGSPILLD